jgi:hypothetical protein
MKLALTGLLDVRSPRDIRMRAMGKDLPSNALTMIGLKRLDNIHMCVEDVLARHVPGDMYESTMDTLVPLYSKVSKGGYIIADDYYCIGAERRAVDEFRKTHGITAELRRIDWTGVYWQKTD